MSRRCPIHFKDRQEGHFPFFTPFTITRNLPAKITRQSGIKNKWRIFYRGDSRIKNSGSIGWLLENNREVSRCFPNFSSGFYLQNCCQKQKKVGIEWWQYLSCGTGRNQRKKSQLNIKNVKRNYVIFPTVNAN